MSKAKILSAVAVNISDYSFDAVFRVASQMCQSASAVQELFSLRVLNCWIDMAIAYAAGLLIDNITHSMILFGYFSSCCSKA